MNAFEKIKKRLEDRKEIYQAGNDEYEYAVRLDKAIEIVNQVAEEYKEPILTVEQLLKPNPKLNNFLKITEEYNSSEIPNKSEDFAKTPTPDYPIPIDIQQYIAELEKKVKNDGWIPVSSRMFPKEHTEVWITYEWADGSIHVGRDILIHGKWDCTFPEAIIAWKHIDIPEPYQPKGEQ